jgi:Uncharacterized protein conserved in bacteria
MIRYALACEQGHEFESWFPSSEAYEEQREKGYVTCPVCGSLKIEKQIMAPSVARTDLAPNSPVVSPEASPSQTMTLLSEKEQKIRAMLKEMHRHVTETAENVGERFPEEARRMHNGETETRSIYGHTTLDEAKSLLEEGIDVMPLPSLPDDKN